MPQESSVPFVSVVIPVYRNALALVRCLDLLQQQSYPHDQFEVIVANNGSERDTEDIAEAYPWVRIVFEPEGGSYAARNAAVRVARGQALAFTDSDCLPDAKWLERGVAALYREEDTGLVAGRIEVVPLVANRPNVWEAYEMLFALQQSSFVQRGFGATANLFTANDVIAAGGAVPFRLPLQRRRGVGQPCHTGGFQDHDVPRCGRAAPCATHVARDRKETSSEVYYGDYVRGDRYPVEQDDPRDPSNHFDSGQDSCADPTCPGPSGGARRLRVSRCAHSTLGRRFQLKLLGRPTLRKSSPQGLVAMCI